MQSAKVKRFWVSNYKGQFFSPYVADFNNLDYWRDEFSEAFVKANARYLVHECYDHNIDISDCQLWQGEFVRQGPDPSGETGFYFPVWSVTSRNEKTGKKYWKNSFGKVTTTEFYFSSLNKARHQANKTYVIDTHYFKLTKKHDVSKRFIEFKPLGLGSVASAKLAFTIESLNKMRRFDSAQQLAERLFREGKYEYQYFLLSNNRIISDEECRNVLSQYDIPRKNYRFTNQAIAFNNHDDASMAMLALNLEENIRINIEKMEVVT